MFSRWEVGHPLSRLFSFSSNAVNGYGGSGPAGKLIHVDMGSENVK